MPNVFDLPVREFLERAGAGTPSPGGGSVAALTGALAVAMLKMVANLTLGREKYRDVEPAVRSILDAAGGLSGEFEALAAEDIAAFDRVMAAYRLPRHPAPEKERRKEAIQDALHQATEIPLEIARAGLETLRQAERLAGVGNELVLSDAGVAGYLAVAAVKSALVNVDVNARLIQNQTYVERVLREKERLEAEAVELGGRVERIVGTRLGSSVSRKE
jgi:formiminotetrahydrofolate cyclodeaminase